LAADLPLRSLVNASFGVFGINADDRPTKKGPF